MWHSYDRRDGDRRGSGASRCPTSPVCTSPLPPAPAVGGERSPSSSRWARSQAALAVAAAVLALAGRDALPARTVVGSVDVGRMSKAEAAAALDTAARTQRLRPVVLSVDDPADEIRVTVTGALLGAQPRDRGGARRSRPGGHPLTARLAGSASARRRWCRFASTSTRSSWNGFRPTSTRASRRRLRTRR